MAEDLRIMIYIAVASAGLGAAGSFYVLSILSDDWLLTGKID